jgi:hypothetical protein
MACDLIGERPSFIQFFKNTLQLEGRDSSTFMAFRYNDAVTGFNLETMNQEDIHMSPCCAGWKLRRFVSIIMLSINQKFDVGTFMQYINLPEKQFDHTINKKGAHTYVEITLPFTAYLNGTYSKFVYSFEFENESIPINFQLRYDVVDMARRKTIESTVLGVDLVDFAKSLLSC